MNRKNVRIAALLGAVTMAATTLFASPAAAADSQPGAVDPAFASTTGSLSDPAQTTVVQPDGKILVGGLFSSYRGAAAPKLVRLNADGSPDTGFRLTGSGLDSTVMALALQPDGKILVGGNFTSYDGTPASHLIRLNADGSRDNTFNLSGTGLDGDVMSLAIQEDGKILAGGSFANYNNVSASRLIRLNINGTRDNTFSQAGNGLDGFVYALAVRSTDGDIYAGGSFANYNNVSASRLIRFNSSGTRDNLFAQQGSGFSSNVRTLAIQNTRIIVGGDFTAYGPNSGNPYLTRLNDNGTSDNTFNMPCQLNQAVNTVAFQSSKILAGGDFTNCTSASTPHFARFTSAGVLDDTFTQTGTGLNDDVSSAAVQSDGRIVLAGAFRSYNNSAAQYVTRLDVDGGKDGSFATNGSGLDGPVLTMARQSDGKILIGGKLLHCGTRYTPFLARINPDGTCDTTFNQTGSGLNRVVYAVAVQPDGKILVAGSFDEYNGVSAPRLIRLNADGSRDNAFNQSGTGLGGSTTSLALQPDGKILVGGDFITYNGQSAKFLIRLEPGGGRDTTFNQTGTGLNNTVNTVAVKGTRILVGGDFDKYNGVDARYLIQLNADGSRDNAFNQSGTGLDNGVRTIAQVGDQLLVGGYFQNYNNAPAPRLIKLLNSGARDDSFAQPGTGFDAEVRSLALQPDGKILVGGDFEKYGTTSAPYVLRLDPTGSRDASFTQSGTGLDSYVYAVALQPDGKVLAGGYFTFYNSIPYAQLTRLLGDPAPPSPTPAPPAKPKGVKVTATTKRVAVRWKPASGAEKYSVTARGKKPNSKKVKKTRNTSATKVKIKATFKARSKIRVCVTAKNVAGTSASTCVKGKVKRR